MRLWVPRALIILLKILALGGPTDFQGLGFGAGLGFGV